MGKLGNTGTVGEHHHKLLIVNHMLPHVRADSLDQDIRLRLTGIAHLFDGDLAFLLYHVRVDHQHVEHMTVGVLRPCVRQDVILRPPVLTFEFDLTVVLSGVNEKVETVLKRNNFQRIIGEENICNHIDLALERAKEIVG